MPTKNCVISGSRAGIGSIVITESGTGNTFMVTGAGAVFDKSGAVSPSLSGVAATGAAGAIAASTINVPGVAATGHAGAVKANLGPQLTGVSATGQVGDVEFLFFLVGVEADGFPGTLAFERDANLLGVAATGHAQGLFVLPYVPIQFRIGVF